MIHGPALTDGHELWVVTKRARLWVQAGLSRGSLVASSTPLFGVLLGTSTLQELQRRYRERKKKLLCLASIVLEIQQGYVLVLTLFGVSFPTLLKYPLGAMISYHSGTSKA